MRRQLRCWLREAGRGTAFATVRCMKNTKPSGSAPHRGAVGKALLVWIVSGSFGLALLAWLVFGMAGC